MNTQADNLSLQRSVRNIEKAQLKRIIMPRHDEICSLDAYVHDTIFQTDAVVGKARRFINYGCKSHPFLLVHIDELEANMISSTAQSKSIFSKVYFDKETNEHQTVDSVYNYLRGFCFFNNKDNDCKYYHPNPLSEVTKLSVELLDEQGQLYSSAMDNLQILSVTAVAGNNAHYPLLDIKLNTYVDKYYFKQNDKILCKLYNINDAGRELKCFLEAGAYVVDVYAEAVSSGNAFDKINHIRVRNKVSQTTTNPHLYSYEFKSDLELIPSLQGSSPTSPQSMGFVMNANLQHTMILELTEKLQQILFHRC